MPCFQLKLLKTCTSYAAVSDGLIYVNIDRKVMRNNLKTCRCKIKRFLETAKENLHNTTTRIQGHKKQCFQQEKHFQKKCAMKDMEPSTLSLVS